MEAKYFSDNSQTAGENESHIKYAKEAKDLIVEIGVLYGTTTRILVENSTCHVIGIDPLIPDSMEKTLIGDKSKFQDLIDNHGERFTFIQDYSFNAIKTIKEFFNQIKTLNMDGKTPSIDYLFIDGDHQYGSVKQDFEDWYPLVKVGGIISIHDSACNRQGPMYWPGPSKLADELINDSRLEYVETRHTMTVFRKL